MSGKDREDFSCDRARWMSSGLIIPLPAPADETGVEGTTVLLLLPPAAVGRNIRPVLLLLLPLCGSVEKLWDLERWG
jgi:hypothetical protein